MLWGPQVPEDLAEFDVQSPRFNPPGGTRDSGAPRGPNTPALQEDPTLANRGGALNKPILGNQGEENFEGPPFNLRIFKNEHQKMKEEKTSYRFLERVRRTFEKSAQIRAQIVPFEKSAHTSQGVGFCDFFKALL